jgi:phospholipid N-methyltransferase
MSIIREFLRHPRLTGAIAASSQRLAWAITADLGLERARLVVELGPGTGAMTEAILFRLPAGARLIAVELNPVLAAALARRFPQVEVVHAAAAELDRVCDPGTVDAVVSGLPWTIMPDAVGRRTLDAVTATLGENGRFATFAYLHAAWTPPARRLAARLAEAFTFVRRSAVVWPNLPPAFVQRAALPRLRPPAHGLRSPGHGLRSPSSFGGPRPGSADAADVVGVRPGGADEFLAAQAAPGGDIVRGGRIVGEHPDHGTDRHLG